jgi:hypothetical protein
MHHISESLSKNVMLTSEGITSFEKLFVILVFSPWYLLGTYLPTRYYEKFENYPDLGFKGLGFTFGAHLWLQLRAL